jgi:hypothetical protein
VRGRRHAPGLDQREADPGKRGADGVWYRCHGWRYPGHPGSASAHPALGHADQPGYSHEYQRGDLPRDSSDENPGPGDADGGRCLVVLDTRAFRGNADAVIVTDADGA